MKFNHYYPSMHWLSLCIVSTLLLTSCRLGSSDADSTWQNIIPPFKNIRVKSQTKTIDPTKSQMVSFERGTQVEIPANAFIDAQGQVVKSPVKLAFEVYDTPAKILASGIPMNYRDSTISGDFESAGMFQITATSQGKTIGIAKNKSLTISYPSQVTGDDFDFFYFEEKLDTPSVATAQIGPGEATKIRKGRWKKLTNRVIDSGQIVPQEKPIDTFQLQFQEDKPRGLAQVIWKLATPYLNPKDSQHNWVLKEKWDLIEVTRPAYIFGNPLNTILPTKGSDLTSNVFANRQRVVALSGDDVRILNTQGQVVKKLKAHDDTTAVFLRFKPDLLHILWSQSRVGGLHLLMRTADYQRCLYDFNGNKIACYSIENVYRSNVQKKRMVFTSRGSLQMVDFSGKTLLGIEPWPEEYVLGEDHLAIIDYSGLTIFDLNGRKLAHKPGVFDYIVNLYDTQVILREKDGGVVLWDFAKNIEKKLAAEKLNLQRKILGRDIRWYGGYMYLEGAMIKFPERPILWVEETAQHSFDKLWNYQTNQVSTLKFSPNVLKPYTTNFQEIPEITMAVREDTCYIFDVITGQLLKRIDGFEPLEFKYQDHPSNPELIKSKKMQRMLVNGQHHVQLLDAKGKLILDFKKYDKATFFANFTKDGKVFTVSTTGRYRQWNTQGELLSTKTWRNGHFNYAAKREDDYLYTFENYTKSYKVYDLQGNLLYSLEQPNYHILKGDTTAFVRTFEKGIFYPVYPRPEKAYQLRLRNGQKEFFTCVWLDSPTLKLLQKRRSRRLKKIRKEARRQKRILKKQRKEAKRQEKEFRQEAKRQEKEGALIRHFKIKRMGLYNWDRLLARKNMAVFQASFDFAQKITSYHQIKVFWITNLNGNAVIGFNEGEWKRFRVDPRLPGKLVAVLPEDKIALFSQEQMKAVDWQKVKTKGKYTFRMKTLDNTVKNMEELTKLIK